jgi:hypothetical protein
VQPAAFSWPPPPKRPAMRFTGISPLPRRLTLTLPGASSRSTTATLTPPMERGYVTTSSAAMKSSLTSPRGTVSQATAPSGLTSMRRRSSPSSLRARGARR